MIQRFAIMGGGVSSDFLDLNHTRKYLPLVSLMIPKFAPATSREHWRTSESGH
jgi:hypothetical protein